jgi:hypothetical protein
MGFYVNPPGLAKEEWLEQNGELVGSSSPIPLPSELKGTDKVLICLIYNAYFTAACIVYDDWEFRACSDPSDPRPKAWFVVSKNLLASPAAGADRGWENRV